MPRFPRALLLVVAPALIAVACASAQDRDRARDALVEQGKKVFTDQGCYGCHTLGKAGTPIALDLSRIGARRSEDELRLWLSDPAMQKPTAHMPKLTLSRDEVRAVAAYLASLRGSD